MLNLKNIELWELVQNFDNKAYELTISKILKAADFTSIFHSWKIYFASNSPFPDQILPPGPSIKISAKNDNKTYKEGEVLEVVDCCQTKQYRVQYKATYIGN